MNETGDINTSNFFPVIYQVDIQHQCFDEILHLFLDEILHESSWSDAESALVNYITSNIEPVGWQAVWRSLPSSKLKVETDFLVEVLHVSLHKLEADVKVDSVLIPEGQNFDVTPALKLFQESKLCSVPLIELYPISETDDGDMYATTAILIEHARLFYKHLCRPWDCEDDVIYTKKVLQPRLQLYFDIKNKVIPDALITRINTILKDGWTIMDALKKLYCSMHVSDSESELTDEDVFETLELRKQIEDLKRQMDMLENPVIRAIMMKNLSSRKSPLKQKHIGPVTTVVAPNFTYGLIMNLKLDPSTTLRFEDCPEIALKECSDGDTILLFPGHYHCDTLGWLESNVTIKGIGSSGSVVLKATGSSEVFLNCDAESVYIENVMLMSAKGTASTVVVHHGKVVMKDCIIDSEGSETGIILLGAAELEMWNTEVCSANGDGIQMRPSSILKMISGRVVACGQNGITVDFDENISIPNPETELSLIDSYIVSNGSHGIFVNAAPTKRKRSSDTEYPDGDFSALNCFHWLKHNITNSVMNYNKFYGVGSGPTARLIKEIQPFTSLIRQDIA